MKTIFAVTLLAATLVSAVEIDLATMLQRRGTNTRGPGRGTNSRGNTRGGRGNRGGGGGNADPPA